MDLGTKITVKQKIIQKTNMTLIKSISGIRGTIGGKSGEGLSPLDAVKFTSAYATLIGKSSLKKKIKHQELLLELLQHVYVWD